METIRGWTIYHRGSDALFWILNHLSDHLVEFKPIISERPLIRMLFFIQFLKKFKVKK
jgi:hypothetical protein